MIGKKKNTNIVRKQYIVLFKLQVLNLCYTYLAVI